MGNRGQGRENGLLLPWIQRGAVPLEASDGMLRELVLAIGAKVTPVVER